MLTHDWARRGTGLPEMQRKASHTFSRCAMCHVRYVIDEARESLLEPLGQP